MFWLGAVAGAITLFAVFIALAVIARTKQLRDAGGHE